MEYTYELRSGLLQLFVQMPPSVDVTTLDVSLESGVLTLSSNLGKQVLCTPGFHLIDSKTVEAKLSKKKGVLTLTMSVTEVPPAAAAARPRSPSPAPTPVSPSLPPPPPSSVPIRAGFPASAAVHPPSNLNFMDAASFLFSAAHPQQLESLIEALQDWRQSRSQPSSCLATGAKIKSACSELPAGRRSSFEALCRAFSRHLSGEAASLFSSFVSSSLLDFPVEEQGKCGEKTPPYPYAPDAAASLTDSSASRVLEYLCATGRLPSNSDSDSDDSPPSSRRPLLVLKRSFLPPPVFASVRRFVLDSHPGLSGLGSSSSLGSGFRSTRGFILRFSSSGIPRFRDHSFVEGLLPFFDLSRSPGCNAFVLNVLVCPPIESSSSSSSSASSLAVGWHRDATLGLKPGAELAGVKPRLAYSVTALYLAVPKGMVGGELLLREKGRPLRFGKGEGEEGGDVGEEQGRPVADEIVSPRENDAAVFRGDAEHAVRAFSCAIEGGADADTCGSLDNMRVSVVLEQYKVPVGENAWLVDFEVVDSSNYVHHSLPRVSK